VGTFLGYHFFDIGKTASFHNSGQHAVQRLLDDPRVDFLGVVYSHQERQPGGIWLAQMPLASCRLHGKLVYQEEDTATHLARAPLSWQRACRDSRESVGAIRRNFAGIVTSGGTQWWHDFSGEGWFDGQDILNEIRGLTRVAQERLDVGLVEPAQVAAFVSKQTALHLRQDPVLIEALLSRQASELCHLGAPVDYFYTEDLPLLAARSALSSYRLIVFLDALCLSEAEELVVRNHLYTRERLVLWLYGAGFLTRGGLCSERMTSLTGVPVRIDLAPRPLVAETWLTGALLRYGGERPLAPVITAVPEASDSGANRIWGRLVAFRDDPIFMCHRGKAHECWWSGAPQLPLRVLQELTRRAGAHLYTVSGDQVLASCGLLAVHAASAGTREIALPCEATVLDASSGAVVADRCVRFRAQLERGDTGLWRIER
jgi:hypothetical protein